MKFLEQGDIAESLKKHSMTIDSSCQVKGKKTATECSNRTTYNRTTFEGGIGLSRNGIESLQDRTRSLRPLQR
jgi:hypothetical protein